MKMPSCFFGDKRQRRQWLKTTEGVFVISGSKDTNIIHIEEQGDFLQLFVGFQFPEMAQPTYVYIIYCVRRGVTKELSWGVSSTSWSGKYWIFHLSKGWKFRDHSQGTTMEGERAVMSLLYTVTLGGELKYRATNTSKECPHEEIY